MPYTHGELDKVPSGEEERMEWYRNPKIPRDRVLSLEQLSAYKKLNHSEYREALPAVSYRHLLVERYGEKGEKVLFAEAFELSEYGSQPSLEQLKELFPF